MSRISLQGIPGNMACVVSNVPAFPGDSFSFGIPEAIGDTAQTYWFGSIKPDWVRLGDGAWRSVGKHFNELSYTMDVIPGEDTIDIRIELRNDSPRHWRQSHAFNCINCGGSPALADHDCRRHWVGMGGRLKRLIEVPRVFGPRPTVQLYSVEGAPKGGDIPFVASFRSTPEDVRLEGWMAIVSRGGKRLIATVSQPALYLFQNREYSCIHSGQSLGALAPGETGRALTRVYFVEGTLREWHARMRGELQPRLNTDEHR